MFFSKATVTEGALPPLPPANEPKIQMSTMGKNSEKKIDCGLRKVDTKLAFVTASMALIWLYCDMMMSAIVNRET
jgi:hypothetical protein